MQGLPGKARLYIAALAAGATLSVALNALRHTSFPHHEYWVEVLAFGLIFFVAESFPVVLARGAAYSVSFVVALAAIIAWQGSSLAAVAAAFAFFNLGLDRKAPHLLTRRVFNGSQMVIATTIAGLAYRGTAAALGILDELPRLQPPSQIFATPLVLAPVLAASLAYFLVNTSLVAVILGFVNRANPARLWLDEFSSFAGMYFAFAFLGFLLGALDIQMGWAAVLLLLVPLLVARNAFQASVKMQASYEATVRSLITAIEVKDSYTRGHAERVAALSEMIAREMKLRDQTVRVIRFAALMHDVGKLGVSTRVLQKAGKLTPEEYEHMKLHAIRGHEIVGEIDFLAEAVSAVRHHHERMDGAGYPDGLKGEEIPLLARIITVADAFDSMTSTRMYRGAKSLDDALAEIHRCAGTQFDPRCLEALERAIVNHGWTSSSAAVPQDAGAPREVSDARAAGL